MKQVNPIQGLLVFIALMISILTIGVAVQEEWGLYGVAITEILILLFALLPLFIYKRKLKEVVPIKKPTIKQIFGVLVLWIATYLVVMIITLVLTVMFPEGMTQVSSSLQTTFTSVPMWLAFIIVAFLPAVCEEIFHRGFLLYSMGAIKNKWLQILVLGTIFGVFHLDVYRFLPTAILGAMLVYIMIETKNIILPILLHFVNNAFSTYMSFQSQNTTSITTMNQELMMQAIGSFVIISAIIPFLLVIGARLIQPKKVVDDMEVDADRKKKQKRLWIGAALCSLALFLTGSVLLSSTINKKAVFETNITMGVTQESKNLTFPMQIEKAGQYTMEMSVKIARGIIALQIVNEKMETIYHISCGELTSNGTLNLEVGTYTVVIDFFTSLKEIENYYQANQIAVSNDLVKELHLDEANADPIDFKFSMIVR